MRREMLVVSGEKASIQKNFLLGSDSRKTHVVYCSVRLQKTRELSLEHFSNDDLHNFCGTSYSGRERALDKS